MATTPESLVRSQTAASPLGDATPAERGITELNKLLHQLQEASDGGQPPPVISQQADNQLVLVKLGVASSLFAAIQCRYAAAAGHALRVALTASAWSLRINLPAERRNALEVAALLHDVGVIGVPDHVLLKPGALSAEEAAIMARSRQAGLQILRHSCASTEVLDAVEYAPAWYDGTVAGFALQGRQIPLGGRMIAICEAFDAMTTDHVYRPARSLENAMVELFECAGTQFDPDLVRQFAEYHLYDQAPLHREVAARWLHTLDSRLVHAYWHLNPAAAAPQVVAAAPAEDAIATHFQEKLLDNMYDAVVFIDSAFQVHTWNHGAERLTGIPAASMRQRRWDNSVLKLCDEKGRVVKDNDCPLRGAILSGVQSLRRMSISGRGGRPVAVDTQAIPVTGADGHVLGAVLVLHDASSETSLEQRCQSLYEKATKDPLTQVANRAEFDRVQETFIAAHQQQQAPCSLLICDIDRFKQVNDTYGHQAGDDAIKSLAGLLKSFCRPGDLVARYGGEEFVMLLADCDNPTAARRAEQIRKTLGQLAQPRLDGRPITASFGVTEIQPGDTPETMLRRADRALLLAKSKGRNMVVQLGGGADPTPENPEAAAAAPAGNRPADPQMVVEQVLVTPVPVKMAVEKLRGFVADHQARIVAVDGNTVRLEICERDGGWMRRFSDRPVAFLLQAGFEEEYLQKEEGDARGDAVTRTRINVSIGPAKIRDRRHKDIEPKARQVLVSFRSYLMASEAAADAADGVFRRVKRMLVPWMNGR